MDGIERRDEIKSLWLSGFIKIAQILNDKRDILQSLVFRFAASCSNRLRREVDPGKVAVRVQFCQAINNAATATPHIQHPDALREPVGQPGHER
ncbi:MAG TPA: hypothetical protein VLA19_31980 [Herpetosiphonaceae bacterium]|nr:hypothetical protein [Herpetosiphonaceae bacterium]